MWVRVPLWAPYIKKHRFSVFFSFQILNGGTRKGTCQASSWSGASRSEGKNSPVDYFCDAGASGPTLGTRRNKKDTGSLCFSFSINIIFFMKSLDYVDKHGN